MGVTCKEHEGDYRIWCDECHERVRARLAEVEGERDAAIEKADTYQRMYYAEHGEVAARLAAVEAERDALRADYEWMVGHRDERTQRLAEANRRLAAVEAERDAAAEDARRTNIASADMADRLAEVEALCDEARSGAFDSRVSFESAVRAAARGEQS